MRTSYSTLGALIVAASAMCILPAKADPDPPPPAELRERAQDLTERARDLKAAGRHEEAKQVMREVQELERQAVLQREAVEFEGRRAELRAKLEALRAEGRDRDAAEVKEHLAQLERELKAVERGRGERPRAARPDRPPPGSRAPEEIERRMHHFEVAIENLHAAGLPEIAERLAGERERIAQRLRPMPERNPALEGEVGRLRAELNELREGMERLKAHIEELHREAPRR